MTPAASYVRQHQLQMQAQAEAEARAARERQESEARAREAGEQRQKMIEKEKERLKSKRGWRKKFGSSNGGSISSITSDAPTGLETTYAEPESYTDAGVNGQHSADQPIVSAVPPQLSIAYGDEGGFDASFDSELLEPPHMPAAGGLGGEDSGDEFETDSLRHWGEGIERSRASAAQFKNPKGILKKTASTPDLSLSGGFEKPFAGRIRANSYDAPQSASASSALHSASTMTHISSSTAGVERLDGVGARENIHSIADFCEGADIELEVFHPLPFEASGSYFPAGFAKADNFFSLWMLINRRTHRKIVIVDDKIAFTGGMLVRAMVDVSGERYRDVEREVAAMLMRE